MSLAEARTPYIVSGGEVNIGFLGYGDPLEEATPATQSSPGIAPIDLHMIEEDLAKLETECNYIVLLVHWGREFTSFPPVENIRKARELMKKGADLIIGTHSHCMQGRISQNQKYTFFGLGNSLFPEFHYIYSTQTHSFIMVRPDMDGKGDDIKQYRWNIGSRTAILLDTSFDIENYDLDCIPIYQAKLSNRIRALDGFRGILVKRWIATISNLYSISDYPRIYRVLGKIDKFIWSAIFQRELRNLMIVGVIRPILTRLKLYEKVKQWNTRRKAN
jgi:hypothetical protein